MGTQYMTEVQFNGCINDHIYALFSNFQIQFVHKLSQLNKNLSVRKRLF